MAGPVWVEDDTIGRALAGLSDSLSGKTGAYIANVRSEIAAREDQRRKLQMEMEKERLQQEAATGAISAERSRQMALEPPTPGQTGWATGAGAIGTEMVPPGGPAPLQAFTPEVRGQDVAAAKTFGLEREKQLADYALAARHASSMTDVATGAPRLAGQAQVAEYGLPTDRASVLKLQTQLKGEVPLTAEKVSANWGEVDARGQPVPGSGGMLTSDGLDAATGRPPQPRTPGGRIVKAGEAKVTAATGDEQLKEIMNHPTYKNALEAGGRYAELVKAFTSNTPEADLHGVYMLAKLFDPNSVVRESEVATAQNTSPQAEKWWGIYNKQLQSKSVMSPQARAEFLNEGYKAASSHYDTAKTLVDYAGERARILGIDPRLVAPPLPAPVEPQPGNINVVPRTTRSGAQPLSGARKSRWDDVDAIVGIGR